MRLIELNSLAELVGLAVAILEAEAELVCVLELESLRVFELLAESPLAVTVG